MLQLQPRRSSRRCRFNHKVHDQKTLKWMLKSLWSNMQFYSAVASQNGLQAEVWLRATILLWNLNLTSNSFFKTGHALYTQYTVEYPWISYSHTNKNAACLKKERNEEQMQIPSMIRNIKDHMWKIGSVPLEWTGFQFSSKYEYTAIKCLVYSMTSAVRLAWQRPHSFTSALLKAFQHYWAVQNYQPVEGSVADAAAAPQEQASSCLLPFLVPQGTLQACREMRQNL